jgi:hypothetical protein
MLAACAASPAADPDRVATRVAEGLAVARTLTAVAQAEVTQSPAIATSERSATLAPVPTVTPALLPTAAPTAAPRPTVPPQPANTPLPEDPTVPGFGTPNGLLGMIVLPGYQGPLDVPVFHDTIVFRLKVSDPAYGSSDGAGIRSVIMSIDSPNGTVYNRTEEHAAYCVFGNPSDSSICDVWRFSEHQNQWPDGTAVCTGQYQGSMNVETDDPAKSGAFWGFNFSIAGDYPPCS